MKNWLTLVRQKKNSFPNESNLSKTERFFKIVSAAIEFPSKKIIGWWPWECRQKINVLCILVLFSWPEAHSQVIAVRSAYCQKYYVTLSLWAPFQKPSWSSCVIVIWSHQNKQLSPCSYLCLGLISAALSSPVAYLMPCIKESLKTVRGINLLLNRVRPWLSINVPDTTLLRSN